jgi:hypothetical protein
MQLTPGCTTVDATTIGQETSIGIAHAKLNSVKPIQKHLPFREIQSVARKPLHKNLQAPQRFM